MPVSAVDSVQPALQHTREQLFTRFRFGQWSRLALVGILAAELHVGGCSVPNFGGGWPRVPQKNDGEFLPSGLANVLSPFNRAHIPAHISEHIAQFIGLILAGFFAFVVLAFIFLLFSPGCWLRFLWAYRWPSHSPRDGRQICDSTSRA